MARPAALTALTALAASTRAHADEIADGAVMKIDHQEIYVNLGRARGLDDGAPLRLKRKVTLRHPVTRRPIVDWIPLGAATVTETGERMSRAVVGELIAELAVGDIAEIYIERPTAPASPTPPPATPAPDAPAPPPIDPDTREVLAVFAAQSGASIDARIAGWERYQSAHPSSPYAMAIAADLDELRELRATLSPGAEDLRAVATVALDHFAPVTARAGDDVELVFVIDHPDTVASGWLHYRAAGTRTYHRVMLRREHDIYLRGAIPAAAVHGDAVEYFVEVTSPTGNAGVAQGTPEAPTRFTIERATITDQFSGQRGRTEITLSSLYLDFANLDRRAGDRTDRELLAEAGVRYRIGGLVKAVAAGYGVFAGEGGADTRWTPENPAPKTGFNYGYAELEVGTTGSLPVSLAGRIYTGVGKTGFELGGEGRIRIGADDGTNLTATMRDVARIGFLSDLRLETWPHRRLPIGVAVGVLDQPTGGELAVRLGVDIGYAIGPVVPVARVSWQGRSIDHAGVGGGLALAFRW
jgi:hypothetical protein